MSDQARRPADLGPPDKPALTAALDTAVDQSPVIRSSRAGRVPGAQDPIYLMLAQRTGEHVPEAGVTELRGGSADAAEVERRSVRKRIEALFQLKKRKGADLSKHGEVLVVMEDRDGNQRVFEATITTTESEDLDWDQSYNTSLVANLEDWADAAGADELVVRTDEPTLRLTLARLGYMPEDKESFVRSWMDRAGVIIRLVLDPAEGEVDPDASGDPAYDERVRKYGKGWAKLLDHAIAPLEDNEDPRIVFNAEIERLEVVGNPDDLSSTVELLGRFTPRYLTDLQFGIGDDDPQMIGAVAVGVADWDATKKLNTAIAEEETIFVPDEWTA